MLKPGWIMKAIQRQTSALVLTLALVLAPLHATTWEWLSIGDYLRLADLVAVVDIADVDSEVTTHGYMITSANAKVTELVSSKAGSQEPDVRIYNLDTRAHLERSGSSTLISGSSPWALQKGKFFVILKGNEQDGYRPFDRFSLQSLEEDKIWMPLEKDGKKEQRQVPVAEAISAFRDAMKAGTQR